MDEEKKNTVFKTISFAPAENQRGQNSGVKEMTDRLRETKFDWRIVNVKFLWSRAERLLTAHNRPMTPAQETALRNLIASVQHVITAFDRSEITLRKNE